MYGLGGVYEGSKGCYRVFLWGVIRLNMGALLLRQPCIANITKTTTRKAR